MRAPTEFTMMYVATDDESRTGADHTADRSHADNQIQNSLHPCRNGSEIDGILEVTWTKCRRNRSNAEETDQMQKEQGRNAEEMQKKCRRNRSNAEETVEKQM